MAEAKKPEGAQVQPGQKAPWVKLGSIEVHNTKFDGSALTTKKGARYYKGNGELVIAGKTMRVGVTLFEGRPGSFAVHIEAPPDNG